MTASTSKTANKTVATRQSVKEFLTTLTDESQRRDSETLIKIMRKVSGSTPVMWGTSIIGFGSVHYKYESGREGDWPEIGFSPRKDKISLYVTCDVTKLSKELAALGKHKTGKGCIYIKTLADVDIAKLEKLITKAYKDGGKIV